MENNTELVHKTIDEVHNNPHWPVEIIMARIISDLDIDITETEIVSVINEVREYVDIPRCEEHLANDVCIELLFRDILKTCGNNTNNIVKAAVDAVTLSEMLEYDLINPELSEIIFDVFYRLDDFPHDPAWVVEEAYRILKEEEEYK